MMIARTLSGAMAHAPFLWPLLRRPTQRFWDKAAAHWDDRAAIGPRTAPLAAALERLEPEPERILELGTGTGAGAFVLADRFPGATVRAVDLSEEMIRRARVKASERGEGAPEFEVADAGALPYDDASFDLVCQQNLPLYAAEVARVVAPGGHVVIASTLGPRTPYYTPDRVLARRFSKLGLEVREGGAAGEGTYFLARRPPTSTP
jgi:ubiquinone/menaquinone biosynthesis C-methylase UbiE